MAAAPRLAINLNKYISNYMCIGTFVKPGLTSRQGWNFPEPQKQKSPENQGSWIVWNLGFLSWCPEEDLNLHGREATST
jgi:hypothetical protein